MNSSRFPGGRPSPTFSVPYRATEGADDDDDPDDMLGVFAFA